MNASLSPTGIDPGPVGVSLILPCLNEALHIEDCVLSLLEGHYPADLIELLVLDGMSSDGTREILDALTKKWPQIKIVDNPGASKPKGLNAGIKIARNDILMRIDGHAKYPPNYIRDLVRFLHIYEADNVGGIRLNKTRGKGAVAQALAAVLTHPFGVGDAKHYTGTDEPVESDIIFLFCVRKSLFEEVGGFDERLTRGQDREFNLRLSRLCRKMVLCPQVTSTYFTRDKVLSFISWAHQSGKTPFEISRLTAINLLSVRNFVPPVFSSGIMGLLMLGIWIPTFWILLTGLLGTYVLLGLSAAFGTTVKKQPLRVKLLLPLSFFLWHFSYGLGAIKELINWAIKGSLISKGIA